MSPCLAITSSGVSAPALSAMSAIFYVVGGLIIRNDPGDRHDGSRRQSLVGLRSQSVKLVTRDHGEMSTLDGTPSGVGEDDIVGGQADDILWVNLKQLFG
ncbi:hypothetical protein GUJ93_ZPchr0009g429 [Zizania palustris]|uniref:Uncharacterized protein n=1 Tax=Zizania palustris TaxID=103762 RepID=A0A8J5RXW3_ZIZPA|nr:hypothetical protein GUJ93_ZPchr0009g429 [Zizania palustris]